MNLYTIAVLATLTTPTLQFTEDSVYTKDNILNVEYIEEYDGTITLKMTENSVIGYTIYDDAETPYVDGVMIDGVPIAEWTIHQFDTSIEHTITVKTVYSTDIFGALVAAKDGDWSLLWQNPLTYIQLIYYAINTIATVVGGVALAKYKKLVTKLKAELTEIIDKKLTKGNAETAESVNVLVDGIVSTLYTKISAQYQDIIKALVLSHSNTNEDTIALMDILKKTSEEDITTFVDNIKKKYIDLVEKRRIAQENAIATIKQISEKESTFVDDGTSI